MLLTRRFAGQALSSALVSGSGSPAAVFAAVPTAVGGLSASLRTSALATVTVPSVTSVWQHRLRNYSAKAVEPSLEFHFGGGDTARLTLPLSSGPVAFHLDHNKTIKSLFDDIRAADPTVRSIQVATADGVRVHEGTSMVDLLYRGPVAHGAAIMLTVDGKTHTIKASVSEQYSGVYMDLNVRRVLEREAYLKVQNEIATSPVDQMTAQDFYKVAAKHGVAKEEAYRLVRLLHGTGQVFLVSGANDDFHVHLKGQTIIDNILSVLRAKSAADLTAEANERLNRLQVLRSALEPLASARTVLEKKAMSHANGVMWLTLGYVTAQIATIARLTWWEYSWDIMEPVSYVVGVSQAAFGFLFFAVTKVDSNYDAVRNYFFERKLKKLMVKAKFPEERYETLKESITSLERDIDKSTKRKAKLAEQLAITLKDEFEHSTDSLAEQKVIQTVTGKAAGGGAPSGGPTTSSSPAAPAKV